MKSRGTKYCNENRIGLKLLLFAALILCGISTTAQDKKLLKEKREAAEASLNSTYEGNEVLTQNQDDIQAEMAYRRAISENDSNSVAKYNLGNLYYRNNSMGEAFMRYKAAGLASNDKNEKHKAYHNLGNVFMKNKEYSKAVEAYKEALRNDPTDDQTRYNFALAKEMLKKQQDENKDNKDKDEDKDQNQDKDENKDQNKDNSKDKKDDQQGEDKKDQQGDQKDKKKEGEDQEQGGQPEDNKPDQGKDIPKENPQNNEQQRRPNQLSPQQVKNILEAMNNEEKKVQEKINAEKVKGKPVRNEKDW